MNKEYAGEILLKHRKNKEWINSASNRDRIEWLYKDREYKSKVFNARETLRHQDKSISNYKLKSGWGTVTNNGSVKRYRTPRGLENVVNIKNKREQENAGSSLKSFYEYVDSLKKNKNKNNYNSRKRPSFDDPFPLLNNNGKALFGKKRSK